MISLIIIGAIVWLLVSAWIKLKMDTMFEFIEFSHKTKRNFALLWPITVPMGILYLIYDTLFGGK